MKTIIILLVLFYSIGCSAQKHVFNNYGLVNNYSNGTVFPIPSKLSVENKGGGIYQIITQEPPDGLIEIDATVKYSLYNNERKYYLYEGTMQFGTTYKIKYNCAIKTRLKMTEFTKGVGNKGNSLFKRENGIEINYGHGNSIDYFDEVLTLFPIIPD